MNTKAWWVAGTTASRRAFADRGGTFVAMGFYVAVVLMVGSLWRAAAGEHGDAIAGYSGAALFWYIAASEAATVALNMRMIENIGTDIASGAIAAEMLRPVSLVSIRIATEIGYAVPKLFALAAAGAALATAVVGAPVDLGSVGLAVVSLVLAIACNIAGQHAFAGCAFWLRDTRSAWFLYQKLVFILGGMLLPIEVLPPGLETVARWSPFTAMAYAPARLAAGHFEPVLLVVQAVWLVALVLAAVAVFAAGERKLQVVGG